MIDVYTTERGKIIVAKYCNNHEKPKINPDDANYCIYCSEPLESVQPHPTQTADIPSGSPPKNIGPWVVSAILAVIAIAFAVYALTNHLDSDKTGSNSINAESIISSTTQQNHDVVYETSPDGQQILDPDVTFVEGPITDPMVDTTSVTTSSGGVVIRFSWINPPKERYQVTGEVWDLSVPGQEVMVYSSSGTTTEGEIFVKVTDLNKVTHGKVSIQGENNYWNACGGFLPIN